MHNYHGNSQCCGSCQCNTCGPTPCGQTPCKGQITEAELGELLYLQGLDINLCKKYQLVSGILGLRDCANNIIAPGTQIVTCAAFQDRLCAVIAALPDGGDLTAGDVVVGADCELLTIPAFQSPITVLDTNCIDLTLAANVLSAAPILSPTVGNILECTANGLFADIDSADLCTALAGLTAGAVAGAGTVLVGTDCLTHALPPIQAPLTFIDSTSVDFTQVGDTVTAAVIISPNAGNQVTNPGNGIYVPPGAGETSITVVDTASVNLTASGTANHTLQADVIISPNAGNQLELLGNGLFVDFDLADFCPVLATVPVGAPAVAGQLVLGSDCLLHALQDSQAPLTFDDSVTVDFSVAGDVVSADVNVSAIPGNIITIQGDGLAVTCASVAACVNVDVAITAADTNCINMTVNEGLPNVFTVSADPIISPTVGNILECTANGLFVAAGTVDCAAIQALFPDEDNILQPGDEILVGTCEVKEFPNFVGVDTNCINTTVAQQINGDFNISSVPTLATAHQAYPAGSNGIICDVDGLSAPPDAAGNTAEVSTGGNFIQGIPLADGQVIASAIMTLNITNPSLYRSALLTIELDIPGTNSDFNSAGVINDDGLEIAVSHAFNLPGILVTVMNVFTTWNVNGNTTGQSGNPPANRVFYFEVPPSFVGSYQTQVTVTADGAIPAVTVGRVGAQYSLVTIDA